MNSTLIIEGAAYFLLILSLAYSGYEAFRLRSRHQGDLFFTVTSFAIIIAFVKGRHSDSETTLLQSFMLLAQPYFLLRLVRHFFDVPRVIRWAVVTALIAGVLSIAVLRHPRPPQFSAITSGYFVIMQLYATFMFFNESRKGSSVTAWRLRLAGIGAGSFALGFLFSNAATFVDGLNHASGPITRLLSVSAVIGYVFGLATPRPIRRFWQREELYRFLRDTAERDPEDRGQHAAEDLSRAASRGAPTTATAVLLGDSRLVVRASSEPQWTGIALETTPTGALGRGRLSPFIGAPGACEGELAALASARGEGVIAVPIIIGGKTGGVLLVVQRRGSLFPDDDVDLLVRLCRHAADTIDHSRLLLEERERRRREADARVQQSESRLRLMIESIKDYAMITVDAGGLITSWNVGARAVFGYSTGAILGQSAAQLFEGEALSLPADLAEARREGHVMREGMCRRADGLTFTGNTVIRPLGQDVEIHDGFAVVTRDVTEQRQLEDRLRQAQKMEAIGRLAGGVAHDFNNLLTVILGYGALLESSTDMREDHHQNVVEIRKAADRAAALTKQLLTFSRQQVIEPRVVSLQTIVRGLLPMLKRVLGEDIRIAEDLRETDTVMADTGQLEQIVVNLAVNARDAMADGGQLSIRTSAVSLETPLQGSHLEAAPGRYAMIEVTDSGTGMSPDVKARIFEPFFTTKEFGRGTGLGLATVYGIVKHLEGGINVMSGPGQGTTFTIYLPHVQGVAEHLAAEAAHIDAGPGSGTVLLVEDEPAVRLLVASVLERDGFNVLAAENLSEALVKIAESTGPLRLVITDVVMPGGNGPELIRQLAKSHPNLRSLMMSGYALTALGQGGLDPDQHFLQKPFTGRELLSKVRNILQ